MSAKVQLKVERDQARADKKRIAELERELRRKEKAMAMAMAETTAIWVLRRNMSVFVWLTVFFKRIYKFSPLTQFSN